MDLASNDFDLDTFLELQSSDEDESDIPMLERTLEEILDDSDDESSSSDGSLNDNRLFFRNPKFTHQQHENKKNTTGAENPTEEGKESSGLCSLEKIGGETGTSYEFAKVFEKKDQGTEIPDSSGSQLAKLTELKLGGNLKTYAFPELGSKPSPFFASSPSSSLLDRSPALYSKLRSVKPNPKPGAAFAAADAASRAVLGPHCLALGMVNAIHPQKSQEFEDFADSSKKIAEHVEKEEEKEREGNETISDAGVPERVFPLHENLSYSELNLVRSDDEMDRRRNVDTDKVEESLPLSEHEEFMIHDDKPKAESVEEKIMSENDKDESTEQCKTDTGVVVFDRNVQAIEYEQCSASANSALDTSLETQSPKSSGTLITPLTNSCSETSPGTQTPISGSTSGDDDDRDANTEENINSSNLFTDPAKASVEQMNAKVVEKISEHKTAKAGDENVVKAESSRAARNIGKTASASHKSLDLAAELEKRDASSGLHGEEGVAAQPMRLEEIRRGPPTIGHLQIDSPSSLSQGLASQIYKHDHGSPQAIAVHLNYIAVGMSKGSVLVNPTKDSAQNPHIMDSKGCHR